MKKKCIKFSQKFHKNFTKFFTKMYKTFHRNLKKLEKKHEKNMKKFGNKRTIGKNIWKRKLKTISPKNGQKSKKIKKNI